MHLNNSSKIKYITIIVIALIILMYLTFRIKDALIGPKIEILNIQYINNDTYLIQGRTDNTNHIYVFDREITLDTSGAFSEYIIAEKYSLVKMKATDKWDRRVVKEFKIE